MNCSYCGQPSRVAICVNTLSFLNVEGGNWVALLRCPQCKTLWQCGYYEPNGMFRYLVPWPWDAKFWRQVHDLDSGLLLNVWHDATLLSLWDRLSEEDRQAVEKHKQRAYSDTPFFPIYATDEEWKDKIARAKSYWQIQFGETLAKLLMERHPAIPDLETYVKHSRY